MTFLRKYAAAAALAVLAAPAMAAPVTPTFTNFGALPGATFGGSGIPNDQVAISTFDVAGGVLTLGLAATPRYVLDPALSNDGAGTYTAPTGSELRGPNATDGALWNFSFFAETTGTQTLADLGIVLFYDTDAGAATDKGDLGTLNVSGLNALLQGDPQKLEGSQNLLFGYLGVDGIGVRAPSNPFDPNAVGEYSFELFSTQGSVAINVNTIAAVPLPASGALLLAGLGLLLIRQRRKD